MNTKLSLVAIATAAFISGCGGGGDSTAVSSPTTPDTPSTPVMPTTPVSPVAPVDTFSQNLIEVPLHNAMPQNTYGQNTPEHHAFEKLNRARIECGFGSMAQDALLDKMAVNQARYNLVEVDNGRPFTHIQNNRSNPFWIAETLWDRAKIAGFITNETNLNGVGEDLSGAVFPIATLSKPEQLGQIIMSLVGAPYHAMDLLAPRTKMGVHVATPANSGVADMTRAQTNGQLSGAAMSVHPGSATTRDQKTQIYQWPNDDVLTYPCNGTTGTILTHIIPESVDVFGGKRDYHFNPVGTPFYVVARHGSKLRISSQKLIEVASGKVIPLLPARYGDTELYPGTNDINTSAKLMDWAFIMPDVALENAKRYRMELTANIGGRLVNKAVEFTPTNALYTY